MRGLQDEWRDKPMRVLAIAATFVLVAVGAFAGAAAAGAARHLHLGAIVGHCNILGGAAAFYLCPPGNWTIPSQIQGGGDLRVTLVGGARSANGREVFDDPNGVGQVTLESGWPFKARGGVVATGVVKPGSIIVFAYSPTPALQRGFAVWKLSRRFSRLTITTTADGRGAVMVADGRRVAPTAVVAPARRTTSPRLKSIFSADMQHLAAVANGNVSGACEFFKPSNVKSDDAACARTIGLAGKATAITAALPAATLSDYNGYVLAAMTIDGQPVAWILDQGHFRFGYGYSVA
jgi:hypothetical protein